MEPPAGVNRTVMQHRTGDPGVVAELVETPVPRPGEGELLVELVVAPINPAEILMLQGAYGYRDTTPPLPRAAGIEGVGRVVGGATAIVPEGSLVSLAGSRGVFSDYRVIPAASALVLPPTVDPDTFAVSFVNVQAVLLMLHEWPELEAGDVIIQNAGNSAYARVLDAVASRRGFTVVNVVRSERSALSVEDELNGPVLVDGEDLDERVLAVTGGSRPRVAVDAVGGAATGRLTETLAPGGRVVTYGLLSGDPVQVDTRIVVFNGVRVEGFWMPRSMAAAPADLLPGIAAEAMEIIAGGGFAVPIAARIGLAGIAEALALAEQGGRDGKVVVTR
ncbi:zinc-dependent alcohol dehydrogenase family protein [Herbiconiux sp. CPCC 203407]|uniref:enoyl-[acyl-carrier-protein] reductase n=1 Tax=Herbiconiux oxytropis TaxID=2970915 RepID=A0AA41XIA0_9MICO|nr:zinc-dependent alcohol dehydrogenase family protein [Herbiconiux oxytropis]MCS5724136.1 zinc-dependent alcohol dehydrogenase family protein [Herbiconiux oxytropis]MCS5726929.1 zinc-dependent alcohol dehydrogenase family protein [Herbiconiux oxytropis]